MYTIAHLHLLLNHWPIIVPTEVRTKPPADFGVSAAGACPGTGPVITPRDADGGHD